MRMRHSPVVVWMVAGFILSCATASVSRAQCLPIPTLSIGYSWPPSSTVQVVNAGVPSNDVGTAIANWNTGLASGLGVAVVCYPPQFSTTPGSGQTIFMSSVATIPVRTNPPGGSDTATVNSVSVIRGLADLENPTFSGGRLFTVNVYILSAMTADAAITETVAHELGHTLGLYDCDYPGCSIFSSVMEANAPTQPLPSTVNGTVGQPGPTSCDILSVLAVASDYACPSPCPQSCTPNYDSNDTSTPVDYCSYPATGCPSGYYDKNGDGCCGFDNTSPVLIDTTGRGFYLTNAKGGVLFDIGGNGHPIQMGWTAPGANDAFLALPGADGLVHSGKQLFGNFTLQPKSANPNGFAALAVYDDPKNGGNGDGVIDSRDAIFSSLRLWIDANHDGISQPEELHTLPSLGVTSISLKYKEDRRTDQYGNVFRYRAQVNPGDATNTGRMAYDVFFVVESSPNTTKNIKPAGKCQVPAKVGMLAPVGGSLR